MTKTEFMKEINELKQKMQFYLRENEQFLAIFLGQYILNAIEKETEISFSKLKDYIQNEINNSSNSFSETQLNLLKNLLTHIGTKNT